MNFQSLHHIIQQFYLQITNLKLSCLHKNQQHTMIHSYTTINENKNLLEYQTPETKVPCLPLSMILLAIHISHSLNTKRHLGSKKFFQTSIKISTFQMHQFG